MLGNLLSRGGRVLSIKIEPLGIDTTKSERLEVLTSGVAGLEAKDESGQRSSSMNGRDSSVCETESSLLAVTRV